MRSLTAAKCLNASSFQMRLSAGSPSLLRSGWNFRAAARYAARSCVSVDRGQPSGVKPSTCKTAPSDTQPRQRCCSSAESRLRSSSCSFAYASAGLSACGSPAAHAPAPRVSCVAIPAPCGWPPIAPFCHDGHDCAAGLRTRLPADSCSSGTAVMFLRRQSAATESQCGSPCACAALPAAYCSPLWHSAASENCDHAG